MTVFAFSFLRLFGFQYQGNIFAIGHEYQSTISHRLNGCNCPYCSNRKVQKGYNDIGVYGNLHSLTSGNLTALQKRIPKWVAQYYKKCEYEGDYIGWQYTSDGIIPGINTRVDLNIFF
jgi:hypothetical protein